MSNYVNKVIKRYKHTPSAKRQGSPYQPAPIQYRAKSQLIPIDKPGTPLDKGGEQYIQQVVGSLLYYARAVDLTILFALSAIAAEQSSPTTNTMQRTQ